MKLLPSISLCVLCDTLLLFSRGLSTCPLVPICPFKKCFRIKSALFPSHSPSPLLRPLPLPVSYPSPFFLFLSLPLLCSKFALDRNMIICKFRECARTEESDWNPSSAISVQPDLGPALQTICPFDFLSQKL